MEFKRLSSKDKRAEVRMREDCRNKKRNNKIKFEEEILCEVE